MKNLQNILQNVSVQLLIGTTDISINSITFDSRKITKKDLFVAIKGSATDGHQFINKAIELGACAVVCEIIPNEKQNGITYIQVKSTKYALAVMAANFYDNPSEKIKLIGITGTNGKTTTATLLYKLFLKAGYKTGLLSTVKIIIDKKEFKTTHTTPDSVTINRCLNEMVSAGVKYCFMEVSSHGIHQKRTEKLSFAGGVFTNLSHDHLDYHGSFLEYRDVKKSFFDALPKTAFALVNTDDKNGKIMLQNTKAKKKTYALKTMADFKAKVIEKQFSGTLLTINGTEVWVKLIGDFNAYNLLAIYGVANSLGLSKLEVLKIISELKSVNGRFQYTVSSNGVVAIVDYAHTPDALKNVLETINDIKKGNEKIITVVGCGGNRDKKKRPKMAYISSQLSNQVVFTNDNPRGEDPEKIIEEMESGVLDENKQKTLSILNRKQAIKTAYKLAKQGDIILIAGKGHETYQEIKGEQHYFNDFEEITKLFLTN